MASLGKLIAGVAHEVKTPLAIIKTRIQMWQQKLKTTPDAEGKEDLISDQSLQIVISEINRLANLVNRLLIFSKPIDENFKKANINALLNDLIILFKSQKYSEKADIIFNSESEIIDAEIDANKIEQVVLNILTNSFESIKSEGLIEIKTRKDEDSVVIQISDDGAGISPEIKGNIFDPFFTTKGSGTGLGLSIAYEIIKAHKGKIEFTSDPGTGTTFTIVLPAIQNTGK
jgi:two-component system sensor histidine kinase AtoS